MLFNSIIRIHQVEQAVQGKGKPIILYCRLLPFNTAHLSPLQFCFSMGGSLETKIQSNKDMYKKEGFEDVDKSFGRESRCPRDSLSNFIFSCIFFRSLKACFELLNAEFTNVKHMKGGFSTWAYEKRPTENS